MRLYLSALISTLFVGLGMADVALASKAHGTFRVVKGDVKIKSGKDGKTTPAKLGGKVLPKDTIICGKDARAKVVMIDNNEINVSPDSQVVFQEYEFEPEKDKKNVLLNVLYGKVRSKVNQKYDDQSNNQFQVKTPSAVAGVRGTDFFTSYNTSTKATEVVTFKGEVAFGLPGPGSTIVNPVSVVPGQFATAAPGQAPQPPQALPAGKLADLERSSDAEVASAPSSGSDGREPAQSGDKDEGKDGKQKSEGGDSANSKPEKEASKSDGNSGSGTASARGGPGPNGGTSGGSEGSRAPASMAPPSGAGAPGVGSGMLRAGDLPSSASGPIMVPELAAAPIVPPPTFQLPDSLRNCDFCRENTEGANRRLLIKIINNGQ